MLGAPELGSAMAKHRPERALRAMRKQLVWKGRLAVAAAPRGRAGPTAAGAEARAARDEAGKANTGDIFPVAVLLKKRRRRDVYWALQRLRPAGSRARESCSGEWSNCRGGAADQLNNYQTKFILDIIITIQSQERQYSCKELNHQ